MAKLADVDADALREWLDRVDGAKAVKRLMVALAYKDGVRVETMSRRYDIPRSTIYYWLDRFESGPIEEAVEDEDRPGRPSRLDDAERRRLVSHLHDSPGTFDYDAAEWTPELVREHIESAFDVSYSTGHVRRLLRELPDAPS
jgi:transposase